MRKAKNRLNGLATRGSAIATKLHAEILDYQSQVESHEKDIFDIEDRIAKRHEALEVVAKDKSSPTERDAARQQPNETQRDFLIRTGKITPFSKLAGDAPARNETTLREALLRAETGEDESTAEPEIRREPSEPEHKSHRILLRPGFSEESSQIFKEDAHAAKRRRISPEPDEEKTPVRTTIHNSSQTASVDGSDEAYEPNLVDDEEIASMEEPDESDSGIDLSSAGSAPKRKRNFRKARGQKAKTEAVDLSGLDDGNENVYQSRLQKWTSQRKRARRSHMAQDQIANRAEAGESEEEWSQPHPTIPDTDLGEGYRLPGDIYHSLFDYQKTGVQWLWELYSQQVGGIVGDEMGLGKTIQVISFLGGLHYSKKLSKPVIIIAPPTVMKQWVNEFHTWWPPLRVSILHTSGSGMIDIGRELQHEEEVVNRGPSDFSQKKLTKAQKAAQNIVNRVVQEGHVLVTTYSSLQIYSELLVPVDWEYAVLDEGHKIRNPNAAVTIYSKELRTANRIILSGTPMQNNLVELWSLFDFVFPMRLGNLVDFKNQFEIPIRIGGYANASNLQVQTASKCAETLKDAIAPYLLQRLKVDVAADLPKKTERVLFCRLTKPQRQAYESFLAGGDMKSILNGKRQVLYGVDILRKICNHPDLQDHRVLSVKAGYNYGSSSKSGKMVVVKELLDVWRKGGHKTLLFAQHRIMLDILESYIKGMEGINYRRMDGTTAIGARQAMVDEFNNNPDAHVFLLTTKVGGLGINLTGADRVIIYDPDWNPSTDIQARERAWRLGQKREVEIYRLMVAGTIEEKIFHRQIFKQFLTNKILKDPKQRQTFQLQDLHDLFTLGDASDETTETSKLFEGTEVRFDSQSEPSGTAAKRDIPPGGDITDTHLVNDLGLQDQAGIASIQPYDVTHAESQSMDTSVEGGTADKRIMEGIFARSGVHSALEHDQIINGRRVIAADPRMIEREAKKVADEAARELEKAEEVARRTPAGTMTWTGLYGTGGQPNGHGSIRRAGPASSSILAGLQDRQAQGGTPNSSRSSTPASKRSTGSLQGKDFLKLIRDFLVAHGNRAYTQNLIDHFNRHCTTPERSAEFKEMLKKVATLQKGSSGRGSWVLKDEYKPQRR